MIYDTAKVNASSLMDVNMKVCGLMTNSMEKGYLFNQMVMNMKGISKQELDRGTDN